MPAFTCPNCGAIVIFDHGEAAVCEHCGWDSSDESTVVPNDGDTPQPLEFL